MTRTELDFAVNAIAFMAVTTQALLAILVFFSA